MIEIWRQAPHDTPAVFWIAFFQVNGGDSTLASFRQAFAYSAAFSFCSVFSTCPSLILHHSSQSQPPLSSTQHIRTTTARPVRSRTALRTMLPRNCSMSGLLPLRYCGPIRRIIALPGTIWLIGILKCWPTEFTVPKRAQGRPCVPQTGQLKGDGQEQWTCPHF